MVCTIESFTLKKSRKVRGTDVEAGATCYALRYADLYFIWSYTDREYATKVAARVKPGNATDVAANWRLSVHETVVSDRTRD